MARNFAFKYGKVEASIKLPKGDYLWPAFWLLPKYEVYGGWPRSGEIDVLEARGNNETFYKGGYDTVSSALHWGKLYLTFRGRLP